MVTFERELREEGRLLHGGVPAADHDQLAIAEEEAVARGAGADAAASQPLLPGDVEPARRRAGGDDQGAGPPGLVARLHQERTRREVDLGDVHGQDLGPEALRLLLHLVHELGAHDPVGEPGVVLDVGRQHELTAGLQPLQDERLEVGARGIEGRGVAGRSGADHDHVAQLLGHLLGHLGASSHTGKRPPIPEAQRSRNCPVARRSHPCTEATTTRTTLGSRPAPGLWR